MPTPRICRATGRRAAWFTSRSTSSATCAPPPAEHAGLFVAARRTHASRRATSARTGVPPEAHSSLMARAGRAIPRCARARPAQWTLRARRRPSDIACGRNEDGAASPSRRRDLQNWWMITPICSATCRAAVTLRLRAAALGSGSLEACGPRHRVRLRNRDGLARRTRAEHGGERGPLVGVDFSRAAADDACASARSRLRALCGRRDSREVQKYAFAAGAPWRTGTASRRRYGEISASASTSGGRAAVTRCWRERGVRVGRPRHEEGE